MTDTPAKQDNPITFLDNPFAPEVLADFSSFVVFEDVVRITFSTYKVNHQSQPGPHYLAVAARLNMTMKAAESFAKDLLSFIETQKNLKASPKITPATVQ